MKIVLAALSVLSLNAFAFEALPKHAPEPKGNSITPEKVLLGKQLYFDKRISKDGSVSCATCHDPNRGGVDGLSFSKGIRGQLGGRNDPTVLNAAFQSVQFWDGRAKSLEEQAVGPMINPVEMGAQTHDDVIARLKKIEGYRASFKKVFGANSLNIDNVAKAIATYERTLITPNSPFDRYQRGDKKALSAQAIAGMKLFQTVGCVSCHSGRNFSGPTLPEGTGFYQKFPMFEKASYVKKYDFMKDEGRFEVTKKDSDKHMYRVPTLRNVAQTAPYFHNGSVKSLDEAVRVMGKTQLNRDLKKAEVGQLVAFLKSLSGKLPRQNAPKMLR